MAELGEGDPFRALAGESAAVAELRRQGALVARSAATVLLLGETGTGKEVMARAIHQASGRRAGPFVAVNCAAVPDGLLEAEFFGYADGAFTGARRGGKPGKFELAAGGTLFLDEIGDLALPLQAKLLRVLQEREVERVGGSRPIRVDVRVIAASNRDLQELVAAGAFRADLYFRLNVVSLVLPPLREHLEDLPVLVKHIGRRLRGEAMPAVAPRALALLQRYTWPGNVRELENVLERAVTLGDGGPIGPELLPPALVGEALAGAGPAGAGPGPVSIAGGAWRRRKRETERDALLGALAQTQGNKAAAARLLGLSRSQFYEKLAALNNSIN
jgi:transcriptional regulator with PAS, ATPase and Fis domain